MLSSPLKILLLLGWILLAPAWFGSTRAETPALAEARSTALKLYRARQYQQAIPHFEKVLTLSEREYGRDHAKTAKALIDLAWMYKRRKRPAEAEPLFRRGLEIRERVLGADHPKVAGTLNGLAGVCLAQGRLDEAERHYRRIAEIRERSSGAEHADTATALPSPVF